MEETIVAIAGISVGFLQGIIILILVGIRNDIVDLWKRVENHAHEVSCSGPDCRSLHSGNVIIPRE